MSKTIKLLAVSVAALAFLCSCGGNKNNTTSTVNENSETTKESSIVSNINESSELSSEGLESNISNTEELEVDVESNTSSGAIVVDKLYEAKKQYEHSESCIVKADGGLNMRFGPSQEYNIIFLIKDGTELECYGKEGDWYYVKYNDKFGWVAAGYVELIGKVASN